jgi:hypothetical protein
MPKPITLTYHGLTGSVRAFSELADINYFALLARLRKGWSVEKALETRPRHRRSTKRTHGGTYSKEYRAWKNMVYRCENPKNNRWHRYGGRGISVCKRWRENYEAFLADVGPSPSERHSLGRLDHDRDYEPGNVAWQTLDEQVECWKRSQRRGNTA